MIFIPAETSIIKDILTEHFEYDLKENKKFPHRDITSHEFDQTKYHIVTTGNQRELLTVSINCPHVADEAKKFGLDAELKKTFGSFLVSPERDYTATVQINCASVSDADKKKLLQELPTFKVHVYAPIFYKAFDEYLQTKKFESKTVPYRPAETIYLTLNEKVFSCIFSVRFSDDDDIVLGKNFLQELKDAKRVDRSLSNAPAVTYTFGAKPVIMKGVSNVREKGNLKDYSFVIFNLFERHMSEQNRFMTVAKLLVFRNYLHYHLKCSKANMHMRMRDRVAKLLQSLEAAKDLSGVVREKRDTKGRYLDVKKRNY